MISAAFQPVPARPSANRAVRGTKYGLATQIPKDWPVAVHEEEDRIFVAIIPQKDFDRPGVAACELALAPEFLDDYRTRIDTTAKRNGRPNGKLATNQIIKDARGERLETIWEFHPEQGGFWREVSVRMTANRQLYTFILNVEDAIYAKVRPAFDALVSAARFTPPNTGADLLAKASNRWIQREYKFALDLPESGPRCSPPARLRSCSPMGRPTVSGPIICWCWLSPIVRPTSRSWRSGFPTSCVVKTRPAK